MKTVVEMAREAGFTPSRQEPLFIEMLERFASLVRDDERADEREACMNALNALPYQRSTKYDCMDAIRARGETKCKS